MYRKADESMDLYHMFTTREWKFHNRNTRELWSLLCQEDRQTFPFSFQKFDWNGYFKNFYYGIREHILKENLSNKEKALSKYRKYDLFIYSYVFYLLIFCNCIYIIFYVLFFRLYFLHQLTIAFMVYILFKICWTLIGYIF